MAPPHSDHPAARTVRDRAQAAARLLAAEGPAAFPRLDQPPFREGDDYVFVFDLHGTLVAHAVPEYRGVDVRTLRDADDQAFGEAFLAIALSSAGEGWVDYRWPRPGRSAPERKRSYVMRVPGRELGVGAGYHPSE